MNYTVKFRVGEVCGFSLAGSPPPYLSILISRSFHERTGALVPNGRPLVVLVLISRGIFLSLAFLGRFVDSKVCRPW